MDAGIDPQQRKKMFDLLKINMIMDIRIGDTFKVFDPTVAPKWNLVRGEKLEVKRTVDGVRYFQTRYGEHFPWCEHMFKALGIIAQGNN